MARWILANYYNRKHFFGFRIAKKSIGIYTNLSSTGITVPQLEQVRLDSSP